MKRILLLTLLVIPQLACAALSPQPPAATAWFTDAVIENSTTTAKPVDALPAVPGAIGDGVLLTKSVAIENPLLKQSDGMISFWIKPNWDGNDGKTHRLLRIGDPDKNGLMLEKAASGMLRYVMAFPEKTTVARTDVSGWKAGQWHHIVIVWMTLKDKPTGIPLWVDKVCMDAPIASGNTFLNPAKMTDKRIWIGDSTSDATMDELVMRNWFDVYIAKQNTPEKNHQLALVYRDYFRTAPYTAIEINPNSCEMPSDKRVVNGSVKMFGLNAELEGQMTPLTSFVRGYGNWGDFDAKPFIKWSTSDDRIAAVEEGGKVTGRSIGRCTLTAEFRGMKDTYDLEVISPEQPDLDLLFVERLPRYSRKSAKWWPDEGESVQSVANIGNYGYKPVPAGAVVRFEVIPDANGNYRADADEQPSEVQSAVISKSIKPGEQTTVTFNWKWTNDPVWVRITLDPANVVQELCEANNQLCDLNIARGVRWAILRPALIEDYKNKNINMVGSFSFYDWYNVQGEWFNKLLREAVYPTTSPVGCKDMMRVDNVYLVDDEDVEGHPYLLEEDYYDGGWAISAWDSQDMLHVHPGLVHEFGHTCFALPDYYGYPIGNENVLLKDSDGSYYSTGPLMSEVFGGGGSWIYDQDYTLMIPSAQGVPCAVDLGPLMSYCHVKLHPDNAGHIQYFARFRGEQFWGSQGRLMPPFGNELFIYDINDQPLKNAAVYVYHVSQTNAGNARTQYFADRPKFLGNTDESGRYVFPNSTDRYWDDPDTDEVDGRIEVWNPFGRVKTDTAFTPNVNGVEGLLLIKIVSGDKTEFHWLPQTEFNIAFYCGQRIGKYTIRTSLESSSEKTRLVRPQIPDAIKDKNLKPVAVAPKEMTVKCGQEFTIDASKSYDPEKQPLYFRWGEGDRWLKTNHPGTAVMKFTAPAEPGPMEYHVYVLDGVRVSDIVTVNVNVVK